jgi:hypothetical protein
MLDDVDSMRANWLTPQGRRTEPDRLPEGSNCRLVPRTHLMWQAHRVDDNLLVMSQRQAARLLDMRPSGIFYWRQSGKIGSPPWMLKELLALKHRADAPARRRGVKAAHGTPSRVGAGCNCSDCRAASAAIQKERERVEAETQFPPETRGALLDLLAEGVAFKQALGHLGVRAHQVWGRAQSDPARGAQLQVTIDRSRPTDIEHGRQSGYRLGCRCSECRAAR